MSRREVRTNQNATTGRNTTDRGATSRADANNQNATTANQANTSREIAPKLTLDQLRAITARIAADPSEIDDLTPESMAEVRAYLHPLGHMVNDDPVHINMSIINWKEKYMHRFLITALIGFLYRLCEEYSPEDEIDAEIERYNNAMRKNPDKAKALFAEHQERIKLIQTVARNTVRKFLNRNFSHDPDRHVRSAHTDAKKYPGRRAGNVGRGIAQVASLVANAVYDDDLGYIVDKCVVAPRTPTRRAHGSNISQKSSSAAAKPSATGSIAPNLITEITHKASAQITSDANAIEQKLQNKPDMLFQYMRDHLLTTHAVVSETRATIKSVLGLMLNPNVDIEDKHGILCKKYEDLGGIATDLAKITKPLERADTIACWEVAPPADVFHQFDRYVTNHYEELRDCVQAFFTERPDVEYGVIVYGVHKTEEDADDYRVQKRDEFRSNVICVSSNAANIIGPFKENLDRVSYYNKDTEILSAMMSNAEAEHKLGADMAAKAKSRLKRKNIDQAGPDAPGLAQYAKVMNQAQALGAKAGMTADEQREYADAKEEARKIREDYEVPDDSIQVDVFKTVINDDGEPVMVREIMYTDAEKPLHLTEGGPWQYQPIRADNDSLPTGPITFKAPDVDITPATDATNEANLSATADPSDTIWSSGINFQEYAAANAIDPLVSTNHAAFVTERMGNIGANVRLHADDAAMDSVMLNAWMTGNDSSPDSDGDDDIRPDSTKK